jgi:UDP-N-acetylglucosamine acyltransferase
MWYCAPQPLQTCADIVNIHPTAIIHSRAELASDVTVAPYAVIEADAQIGAGCEIGAHASIKRFTTLGVRNRVFEGAILGGEPQDIKFRNETSRLRIGDDNLIREYATLHRASGEGAETIIGSNNFIMIGVHIAHNCRVGDANTFANGAALAGHCEIEDHAFLSSNVGLHQFTRVGRFAMVGGKSKIVQDVLPFFTTDGNPPRVRGLNSVGLRRGGFDAEDMRALRLAHRVLFGAGVALEMRLQELERHENEHIRHLARFIRASKRGFVRSDVKGVNVADE